MVRSVKFLGKSSVDNLDSLCCWCYQVSSDHEDTNFKKNSMWGLDFSDKIEVADPEHYNSCNEYMESGHRSVPEGKKIVYVEIPEDTDSFKICFISSCTENTQTEFSLETWHWQDGWTSIPYSGSGRIVGPAVAANILEGNDLINALAKYDAIKTSYLFNPTSFPVELGVRKLDPHSPAMKRDDIPTSLDKLKKKKIKR